MKNLKLPNLPDCHSTPEKLRTELQSVQHYSGHRFEARVCAYCRLGVGPDTLENGKVLATAAAELEATEQARSQREREEDFVLKFAQREGKELVAAGTVAALQEEVSTKEAEKQQLVVEKLQLQNELDAEKVKNGK